MGLSCKCLYHCETVRSQYASPTSLPFPLLGLTALISRLGRCLDSSLGEAVNPLQGAAEVCSQCALPGWVYGTVRHLQPPPTCAQEDLCSGCRAGQADASLAADAVGFAMVMCECASAQPGCYWGARGARPPLGAQHMIPSLKLAPRVAFAACQLPPVYLFNCFGCFFPFPLGVCLPELRDAFLAWPPCPRQPFAPRMYAWVRRVLGSRGEAQHVPRGCQHLTSQSGGHGRGRRWGERPPALVVPSSAGTRVPGRGKRWSW